MATPSADAPPAIASWQFALRFVLEVGSLIALGVAARQVVTGEAAGWAAAIAVPLCAAGVWGVFGVPGDTRGAGTVPVPVPGWARVAIETCVLGAGAAALALVARWAWFGVFAAALALDQAGMRARIRWLLRQR